MKRFFYVGLVLGAFFLLAPSARAVTFVKGASLSGSTFRVLDPQHAGFKASASSDNYRLFSTIGDVAIGSSSGTTFGLRSGFLYYPLVIAPALSSAVPGNAEVSLSWTSATLDAGWTLSGYNVCTKPPAGAFTCEDVGVVTSFMKIGLTNGTTYSFKVQAKEIFGEVIAESGVLTAKPKASGGGGGGGGGFIQKNSLNIDGWSYPGAVVTVLLNGVLVGTDVANSDGSFEYHQSNITTGTHTFGFWARDTQNRSSVVLSLPLIFSGSTVQNVSNIIVAPTIALTSPDSVSPGQSVSVRGAATPNSRVRVRINPGGETHTVVATGNGVGTYEYTYNTAGRSVGAYDISARTELSPSFADVSQYSQLLPFGVGVPAPTLPATCGNAPDISRDRRVNLVDFSILAFWWRRTPLPPLRTFDLNCDNRVALDDFSILAFHWSG